MSMRTRTIWQRTGAAVTFTIFKFSAMGNYGWSWNPPPRVIQEFVLKVRRSWKRCPSGNGGAMGWMTGPHNHKLSYHIRNSRGECSHLPGTTSWPSRSEKHSFLLHCCLPIHTKCICGQHQLEARSKGKSKKLSFILNELAQDKTTKVLASSIWHPCIPLLATFNLKTECQKTSFHITWCYYPWYSQSSPKEATKFL